MEESREKAVTDSVENAAAKHELLVEEILSSLRGLRFGSVNIVVQDGVIVQIDRTDKRRLTIRNRR